jgi:HAD superfamily hydrolase (TIGR01509 family)
MDGVLVDSEPYIAQAAVAMFAGKGVSVNPADFHAFIGMGEDRFLGGVAELYGVPLTLPEDKVRTYQIYLDLVRGRMGPAPGVLEFLERCQTRDLKLAIASSADVMKVEGNLAELAEFVDRFGAVITGTDVERKKPSPDIFLEAARRIGVDPTRCLVIEDAVAGVTAAKAAGARCLGLASTLSESVLAGAGADWTATSLADAPPAVLEW